MIEFENINKYLFNRYTKLVIDKNNSLNLRHRINDKELNIINLLQSLVNTNTNCNLLRELLSKYIQNITYYKISKKNYYKKFIYSYMRKVYYEYKNNEFSPSNLFINQILKEINKVGKKKIEKKIKKKYISAVVKRLVWNKNLGEKLGKAKCMCCNITDITQMSFNCGHIIAESKGGETSVSNLKPICQNCNSSMGTKNMYEFMKTLK